MDSMEVQIQLSKLARSANKVTVLTERSQPSLRHL